MHKPLYFVCIGCVNALDSAVMLWVVAKGAQWKLACLVGHQPLEGQYPAKLCCSTETDARGPCEAYALRNQESLLHQM